MIKKIILQLSYLFKAFAPVSLHSSQAHRTISALFYYSDFSAVESCEQAFTGDSRPPALSLTLSRLDCDEGAAESQWKLSPGRSFPESLSHFNMIGVLYKATLPIDPNPQGAKSQRITQKPALM